MKKGWKGRAKELKKSSGSPSHPLQPSWRGSLWDGCGGSVDNVNSEMHFLIVTWMFNFFSLLDVSAREHLSLDDCSKRTYLQHVNYSWCDYDFISIVTANEMKLMSDWFGAVAWCFVVSEKLFHGKWTLGIRLASHQAGRWRVHWVQFRESSSNSTCSVCFNSLLSSFLPVPHLCLFFTIFSFWFSSPLFCILSFIKLFSSFFFLSFAFFFLSVAFYFLLCFFFLLSLSVCLSFSLSFFLFFLSFFTLVCMWKTECEWSVVT